MKKVNYNKQMQRVYKRYLYSDLGNDLYNCYDNPSHAKRKAMEYCENLCNEYNGYDLTIIGYNSMTFSVGFLFYRDDKTYFAYITRDYNRYCEIM